MPSIKYKDGGGKNNKEWPSKRHTVRNMAMVQYMNEFCTPENKRKVRVEFLSVRIVPY